MDTTAIFQALPDDKNVHIYLLFEAGVQPLDEFQIFRSEHAASMYSLYLHPQLKELQEYGPWLLEVDDRTHLSGYLDVLPGIVGIIVAHRHLSSIAIQLSRGCTVVKPDNHTSLLRFYAQHVLSILALSADSEWHAFLFQDIRQWWIPGKEAWKPLTIPASVALNPKDNIVRLDKKSWQQIADKPEVSSVLAQWQKMPSVQYFPPCVQRDMVVKALGKAKEAGLTEGAECKIYALYYLNGGNKVLESEEMQVSLRNVSDGKISLKQVLANLPPEDGTEGK